MQPTLQTVVVALLFVLLLTGAAHAQLAPDLRPDDRPWLWADLGYRASIGGGAEIAPGPDVRIRFAHSLEMLEFAHSINTTDLDLLWQPGLADDAPDALLGVRSRFDIDPAVGEVFGRAVITAGWTPRLHSAEGTPPKMTRAALWLDLGWQYQIGWTGRINADVPLGVVGSELFAVHVASYAGFVAQGHFNEIAHWQAGAAIRIGWQFTTATELAISLATNFAWQGESGETNHEWYVVFSLRWYGPAEGLQ